MSRNIMTDTQVRFPSAWRRKGSVKFRFEWTVSLTTLSFSIGQLYTLTKSTYTSILPLQPLYSCHHWLGLLIRRPSTPSNPIKCPDAGLPLVWVNTCSTSHPSQVTIALICSRCEPKNTGGKNMYIKKICISFCRSAFDKCRLALFTQNIFNLYMALRTIFLLPLWDEITWCVLDWKYHFILSLLILLTFCGYALSVL